MTNKSARKRKMAQSGTPEAKKATLSNHPANLSDAAVKLSDAVAKKGKLSNDTARTVTVAKNADFCQEAANFVRNGPNAEDKRRYFVDLIETMGRKRRIGDLVDVYRQMITEFCDFSVSLTEMDLLAARFADLPQNTAKIVGEKLLCDAFGEKRIQSAALVECLISSTNFIRYPALVERFSEILGGHLEKWLKVERKHWNTFAVLVFAYVELATFVRRYFDEDSSTKIGEIMKIGRHSTVAARNMLELAALVSVDDYKPGFDFTGEHCCRVDACDSGFCSETFFWRKLVEFRAILPKIKDVSTLAAIFDAAFAKSPLAVDLLEYGEFWTAEMSKAAAKYASARGDRCFDDDGGRAAKLAEIGDGEKMVADESMVWTVDGENFAQVNGKIQTARLDEFFARLRRNFGAAVKFWLRFLRADRNGGSEMGDEFQAKANVELTLIVRDLPLEMALAAGGEIISNRRDAAAAGGNVTSIKLDGENEAVSKEEEEDLAAAAVDLLSLLVDAGGVKLPKQVLLSSFFATVSSVDMSPAMCTRILASVAAILKVCPHKSLNFIPSMVQLLSRLVSSVVDEEQQEDRTLIVSRDRPNETPTGGSRPNQALISRAQQLSSVVAKICARFPKEYGKVAPYLLANYVEEFRRRPNLNRRVRDALALGVYALLDKCDEYAISMLATNLGDDKKDIFRFIYEDYRKYYQYKGYV